MDNPDIEPVAAVAAVVAAAPSPGPAAASADPPSAAVPNVQNPPPPSTSRPSPSGATANTTESGGDKEDNEVAMPTIIPTPMEVDVSNNNSSNPLAASTNTPASSAQASAAAPASAPAPAPAPAPASTSTSSSTPKATITYTHACFLCCRKFPSLEHLLKHQTKSKLHKTNLEREKALKREMPEAEDEEKSDAARHQGTKKGGDGRRSDISDGSNSDDDDDDDDDNSEDDSDSAAAAATRSNKRKHRSSSKRSSKPRRLRSRVQGPVQVWRCSSCNDAYFDTYEEAFEHESRCARRSRRVSSAAGSSSDSEEGEAREERAKARATARAKAKESRDLEQKRWKEEDERLKAKGIEQGGKGVPLNLSAEDRKILSDYNTFLFENVEMFVADRDFNDQLVASAGESFANGTWTGKLRVEGTVGLRCIHCKYRLCSERAPSYCVFPGRLSIFSTHLHQITSNHFPQCRSLPDGFRDQMKIHKDNMPMQSYLHGFLGMNAFVEKHGSERWNLEELSHGLRFVGTELVQPDYMRYGFTPKKNLQKAAKSTSNVSSSLADDVEELSPATTGTGRSISGIDDISSEKHAPNRKRGSPRLSGEVRQRREKEQITKKKNRRKKKRRKKRPEDVLLKSIADQVPFGLSKSDPKDAFSPLHKLLREATEVFVIRTRYEAIDLTPFGDPLLKVGACGLRCKFCQDLCVFPAHVEDIYNKVRRGIQDHISSGECEDMSQSLKRRYFAVENEGRSPNISTLYRTQAKEAGLYDIGEREGLGLRGVSTALINANIEGTTSSSSNSDSDGDAMSVSSSSMSDENESDDAIDAHEEEKKKLPATVRKSYELCKYPGCDKFKQSRCEGLCIRHYRDSLALFDSDQSSDRKSALCSVKGCSKFSRSNGNGMCKRHHTQSLREKNEKKSPSRSRTKDTSKGPRTCSFAGCTKQRQYQCNGMCYRHHRQSTNLSNESSESDDDSSSSSDSDTEHPTVSALISREERATVSPYRLKLLSSLQLCYLSHKDAAKNHKRKVLPIGMPGVKCKYCSKLKVFGVADTLWFNVSKGKHQKHLTSECTGIHYKQKMHLERLGREEEESDRSTLTAAVPKSLRSDIYQRMVERATSKKYLSKKAGKKLLKTAKERFGDRKKS